MKSKSKLNLAISTKLSGAFWGVYKNATDTYEESSAAKTHKIYILTNYTHPKVLFHETESMRTQRATYSAPFLQFNNV